MDAGALVGGGYEIGQIRIEIQIFVGKADAELLLISRFVIPSQKIQEGLEGKEKRREKSEEVRRKPQRLSSLGHWLPLLDSNQRPCG